MSSAHTKMGRIQQFVRDTVSLCLYYMPKKTARAICFRKQHGYKMDFQNPCTLDEKLNWLLANRIGSEYGIYADKVRVRDYVKEKGFEELLPTIYGVWEHAKEIPIKELPGQFILKCNHASGDDYYEIVRNKEDVKWDAVLDRLEKMLHTNYAKLRCQYQYDAIKPLVYAEELLDDGQGKRMNDYKVFCYYGKPYCIMVCEGRGSDLHRAFYDTEWNFLDYTKATSERDRAMKRPKGLKIMLEASKVLAEQFPFARMDFYDVDGRVYFGEITLTPDNCNIQHIHKDAQKLLGGMLDLSSVMC